MKRSISSILIAVLLPLGASAAVLTASSDASAQHFRPPPAHWVAHYRPVYYHGYAHYYYNGRWGYYRPGLGWYYYDSPPAEICHYAVDYYGDRSVVCR